MRAGHGDGAGQPADLRGDRRAVLVELGDGGREPARVGAVLDEDRRAVESAQPDRVQHIRAVLSPQRGGLGRPCRAQDTGHEPAAGDTAVARAHWAKLRSSSNDWETPTSRTTRPEPWREDTSPSASTACSAARMVPSASAVQRGQLRLGRQFAPWRVVPAHDGTAQGAGDALMQGRGHRRAGTREDQARGQWWPAGPARRAEHLRCTYSYKSTHRVNYTLRYPADTRAKVVRTNSVTYLVTLVNRGFRNYGTSPP